MFGCESRWSFVCSNCIPWRAHVSWPSHLLAWGFEKEFIHPTTRNEATTGYSKSSDRRPAPQEFRCTWGHGAMFLSSFLEARICLLPFLGTGCPFFFPCSVDQRWPQAGCGTWSQALPSALTSSWPPRWLEVFPKLHAALTAPRLCFLLPFFFGADSSFCL